MSGSRRNATDFTEMKRKYQGLYQGNVMRKFRAINWRTKAVRHDTSIRCIRLPRTLFLRSFCEEKSWKRKDIEGRSPILQRSRPQPFSNNTYDDFALSLTLPASSCNHWNPNRRNPCILFETSRIFSLNNDKGDRSLPCVNARTQSRKSMGKGLRCTKYTHVRICERSDLYQASNLHRYKSDFNVTRSDALAKQRENDGERLITNPWRKVLFLHLACKSFLTTGVFQLQDIPRNRCNLFISALPLECRESENRNRHVEVADLWLL